MVMCIHVISVGSDMDDVLSGDDDEITPTKKQKIIIISDEESENEPGQLTKDGFPNSKFKNH